MEALQLIEANPDPTKSAVMTRAAELVAEGYDRPDAVSMSWDDILGEDFGLDDSEDEPDYGIMLATNKPLRRRNNNMENSLEEGGISAVALLSGFGYLLWCAIVYKQSGIWSWAPWKTAATVQKRLAKATVVKQPSNNGWEQPITLIVP